MGALNGRALVFEGPGRLSVVDREPQPLGATEVRIRTNSAGICGSDVHGFTGANQRRVPGMVMGHEAVGVVVERGSDVTDPAVGDRVVVNAVNAVPFEGPAPLEWGALVEPFAVGGHGAGLLGGPLEHGVLVIGAGPIGVGAALGARRRGIDRVVVSETNAHRRAVAETLGLRTFDPASSLALEPFDGAVECVAAPATLRDALTLTRPGGEIVVVGLGATEMEFSVQQLVVGERVMRGSFNYSRAEFAAVARWVSSGEVDLTPVIEARVDIEGLIEAFHGYAAGSSDALKTVFQPGLTPDGTRS